MVFKSLAIHILDKYLKDYIQNLDTKRLKLDLWHGNVVLKNLHLKPDALANLNLPFTVVMGNLRSLSLHISWKHLYTHPINITIDGLYILIEPNIDVQYNAEQEEKEQHNAKMKEVYKVEEYRRAKEEYDRSKKGLKHRDKLFERLELHLIRNLEVSISNIHIAFEDKTTKAEHPFSFGLTLDYIKFQATNADWERTTSKDDSSFIYKFGELNNLSIYWNCNITPRSDLSKERIINDLHTKTARDGQTSFENMNYILQPANITAKLKIGKIHHHQDYTRPALTATFDLGKIYLNINRDQYLDLLDLLEFFDYNRLQSKYIKYYAMVETDKRSRRRWRYAYNVIVNELVRPHLAYYKWDNIKANLERCREYHTLYFKEFIDETTEEEQQRARELEKQLNLFNLLFIRRTVELAVIRSKAGRKEKSLWDKLSNWWHGDSNSDNPVDLDPNSPISIEEKKNLYDAIGYEDDHKTSSYPEEYMDIDVSVRLNLLEINVWSNLHTNNSQLAIIASTIVSNTGLTFQRRPANPAFLIVADIDTLGVYGTVPKTSEEQIVNNNRPVLVQCSNQTQLESQNLLHIEFETNPLNTDADYRIQAVLQALSITYDAMTVNNLMECFQPGTQRQLQGLKKAAYSISADIQHRIQFLWSHYFRNIKALDIEIDLQTPYIVLPENGSYQNNCSAIYLNSGHCIARSGRYYLHKDEEHIDGNEQDARDPNRSLYFPLNVRLEDIRLSYIKSNQNRQYMHYEQNSTIDLIRPITLDLDIFKCIHVDDAVLPLWKMDAQFSSVECRLSDQLLLQLVKFIRSIPFPKSKSSSNESITTEDLFMLEPLIPTKNTKRVYETIESIIFVKEKSQQADHNKEEYDDIFKEEYDGVFKVEINRKQPDLNAQFVELEVTLDIPRIDLLMEKSVSDKSDESQPFFRILFVSIAAHTTVKTFDVDFDASLMNLIVFHEQFVTNDNQPFRLFSNAEDAKLLTAKGVLTSTENPLFYSSPYDGIENKLKLNISKPLIMLQMEPFVSILRFRNNLMNKILEQQQPSANKTQKKEQSTAEKGINKNLITPISPRQIDIELEQCRMIVGTQFSHTLDLQLDRLMFNISQSSRKTSAYLVLQNIHVHDLLANTRYQTLITQHGPEKQILHAECSFYNHSKIHRKRLDKIDLDIKIHLTKMNIVLLYKYVDLLINVFNAFQMTKTKKVNKSSSSETNIISDTMMQFHEHTIKIYFDINVQAPSIFIPINSYSNEGIFIDLGQLTLQTHLIDDLDRALIEQQDIVFKNLLVSRVNLNEDNEILNDIILLECAEFHTSIDSLLHSNSQIENEPKTSIRIEWETIDLNISKDDFLCIIKIRKENFSEKIYDKFPQPIIVEQLEDEQANQDTPSSKLPINKQKNFSNDKIDEKVRLDFAMKRIGLTLFFDKTNLIGHRITRNPNSKCVNLRIEMIEGQFRQFSDLSYNIKGQIQTFLLDDSHETHLLNRNFNIDPKTQMFIVTVDYKPKTETNMVASRQVNIQLESFIICLNHDSLMTLKDLVILIRSLFSEVKSQPLTEISQASSSVKDDLPPPAKPIFISTHDQLNRKSSDQSISASTSSLAQKKTTSHVSSQTKNNTETRIDILIKTSQICWLEDSQDINAHCLVLGFSFLSRIIMVNDETHLYSSVKGLTVYDSSFAELKQSKIKYNILKPVDTDIVLLVNSESEKFDIRLSDIAINIAPAAIRSIVSMIKSIKQFQTTSPDKREQINSKSLFDPKPFKDASYWFLKDLENNQQMTKGTDILEVTTGVPSQKKTIVKEKDKQDKQEKKIESNKVRSKQITVTTKLIEVKLELGTSYVTKPVIAMCLSDLSIDVKNWSSDLDIFSRVYVELALFNDHLLAWESLIDPIVDQRGKILSPWCITCSTLVDEDDNENELQLLNDHPKSLLNDNEQTKETGISLNAKHKIHIQAEYLLNLTLTKTTINLAQRLSSMFMDAYKKELPCRSDDDDKLMLTVHNRTGYEILIDNIIDIEFADNNQAETSVNLKHLERVLMTVPSERLAATHLPDITEQMNKRRQQFSVNVDTNVIKVDINRTWKRVYNLYPSPFPNWPIQMLCDSQIHNDHRRIILSSIVKIYNGTTIPLVLLDVVSVETRKYHAVGRIEKDGEYYLPIQLLYMRSTSRLFIGIDDGDDDNGEQVNDFISFDWANETTADRMLKRKNGENTHLVFYNEPIEAYSENTDEPFRTCFHIYIKLALHIINLLPIDVICSIDNDVSVDLKPSELYHSLLGNKKSVLTFTILSYNHMKWTSDPVDLKMKGYGHHNEYMVEFHCVDTQESMMMILRVETYQESYRASLYSPFWVINCTDLKFDFKIDQDTIVIGVGNSPFFVCSKQRDHRRHKKKAHIRLYSIEQDETVSQWSEGFSLNVIKTTGMTNCKVYHDRTYMICVNIVTASFGLSKIITLFPFVTILNKSTVDIEVIEIDSGVEQDEWKLIKPEEMIPFWPYDIKESMMRVRYVHNRVSSSIFPMNNKHRTLLRMNDEARPALHVEVTITDFDGLHIVFGDYKIGDAPVLLINCLRNQPISYGQEEDEQTELLPARHYVYYTWIDPFKPQELSISYNSTKTTIQLKCDSGMLESSDQNPVYYVAFLDGPQTVLLLAEDKSIIDTVSGVPSSHELMSHYLQISFREIGIAIMNDITRNDLFYITVNKSEEIWVQTYKSSVKALSRELNYKLEKAYKNYSKHRQENPHDKKIHEKKYKISKHRYVSFTENLAEITHREGYQIRVQRQQLDGLWIGYAWSVRNAALHARINQIQIDNQLEYAVFPVIFHPIISKVAGTDTPGKPFIELSAYQTTVARSKTVHIKYFKLAVQEFVFCADQGLIVSIFGFVKSKKKNSATNYQHGY